MIHRRLKRMMTGRLARRDVEISSTAPTLCITFDDVPSSACTLGAQIVEQSGGRATFYASGGLESATSDRFHKAEDLQRLQADGHEIGCHGYNHISYPSLTDAKIQHDIELNQAYFQAAGLTRPVHFAYPYGAVNARAKRLCGPLFDTCRGVHEGSMQKHADTALLQSYPLHASKWSAQRNSKILQTLKDNGGWVIFYAHGVSDDPTPFDTTPDILTQTLREANALGLKSSTMSEAFAALTKERPKAV